MMVYQTRAKNRAPKRGGFNSQTRMPTRGRFKATYDPSLYIKKSVSTTPEQAYLPVNSFADFNFGSTLKSNIVYKGYTTLTPIQDQAIKPILEGRDVIGLASTGTGKTAAFLIPLIHKLSLDQKEKVLVITPTRELAMQIQQEFKDFAYDMRLYSTAIIGGASSYRQIYELRKGPHMVIATPGRLRDLIVRREINLGDYKNVVLDEVDLMVDIGFINDIKYFTSMLPRQRQSLFFSATISPRIQAILGSFVNNAVTVAVKKQEALQNIDQDVVRVGTPSEKVDKLYDLLIQKGFDKVLIFGSTKHGMDKLQKELQLRGFKVGVIHGNKTQTHRQKTLQDFKADRFKILLATDVASRGLDIPDVTHVINYELPETYEDYIHRIGRTGRANKKGVALTFC